MGIDFSGFLLRSGRSELREEQSAVAGEGAAGQIERDRCRPGTFLRDPKELGIQSELAGGTIRMEDDFLIQWLELEFW